MAKQLAYINTSDIEAIAQVIRQKKGVSTRYKIRDMASAINEFSYGNIRTQEKTITPSEESQEITPDEGYLLSKVFVSGIDPNFIGGGINIQYIYTGSSDPSNEEGNDGDLYLKI